MVLVELHALRGSTIFQALGCILETPRSSSIVLTEHLLHAMHWAPEMDICSPCAGNRRLDTSLALVIQNHLNKGLGVLGRGT